MSSSSFPLLRLPFLALREIIEKIAPYEQFKLSLCSKRMHFVVKNYRCKSSMFLSLRGFENYTNIYLISKKYLGDEVTFLVRSEGDIYCWATYNNGEYQSGFKETDRFFSCENTIQGTKFLVEFLCDLFAVEVEIVEVVDNTIWMLNFVEERQGAFSYDADVWNNNKCVRTDEQLRHILLDLNPGSLNFDQITSNNFRIENFHKMYENLTISAATWISVENLYQLDCAELQIHDKYFSNTDINRYLKHVLSGGAPRLREFSADVQDPTENVIFDGIQKLLTESERFDVEEGNWTLKGKVTRGLVLVQIDVLHFGRIFLCIKELEE